MEACESLLRLKNQTPRKEERYSGRMTASASVFTESCEKQLGVKRNLAGGAL
jgi:hypothetical protein